VNEAVPHIPVDERSAETGWAGFARALLRRLQPRLLLLALGILCATQLLGRMEYFRQTMYVWPQWRWKSSLLIDSLLIAGVMLAVLVADEAVSRGARRWTTYVGAVIAGCVFAAWTQWEVHALFGWVSLEGKTQPLRIFFSALLYGTLACFVYVNLRTARLAADRMRAAELARAKSRRRTLESRLQALQARVEPQFLFNTMAQVRELYESDAVVAGRVLDDLISYLRAALPHLRESTSTLGQETTLARAYLDIMRVRLGERLDFSIDVPEGAKAVRMPPMMLLPLMNHALVCSLQPGDSGRTIRITTVVKHGRLRLVITDSGVAFLPGTRSDGLDSIAERLHALYGDDARFALERTGEQGTSATLEIPYETTDGRNR
jgi:sensor histidine kinase YesM